ncbi:SAM-dependent methyltransferase [Verrucomicrobiales bacterium]|nr:SAM-dependent methyltransferase [Verrucomicrobiales bacterium]
MKKLKERLKNSEQISFKAFMRMALYDQNDGYYTQNIRNVGRNGDFSTSATINNSLAKSINSWIKNRWKENKELNRNILEIGAGNGSLADSILKSFKPWARLGINYHIVETSPKLIISQKERLKNQRRINWHEQMADALEACSGNTLIISNELVDAFPVELIEWNKETKKWHRVMIQKNNGSWLISIGDEYSVGENSSINNYKDFNNKQRIERHDQFISWFHEWQNLWKVGHMLTIDYGEEFPAIYHRRPNGTLRSYFHHERYEQLEEILSRPGLQDITSDVDFSDIRKRMLTKSIKEVDYMNQADFIMSHTQKLDPMDPSIAINGAGSAFKVLWHEK